MPTVDIKLTTFGFAVQFFSKFKDVELTLTVPYGTVQRQTPLNGSIFYNQGWLSVNISDAQKPSSSVTVIGSYLATINATEMTDDITSDLMELSSSFDNPVFKSHQVSDYFYYRLFA